LNSLSDVIGLLLLLLILLILLIAIVVCIFMRHCRNQGKTWNVAKKGAIVKDNHKSKD
jgi:type II secretory pathway component PulF